jgi:hypothetical protein
VDGKLVGQKTSAMSVEEQDCSSLRTENGPESGSGVGLTVLQVFVVAFRQPGHVGLYFRGSSEDANYLTDSDVALVPFNNRGCAGGCLVPPSPPPPSFVASNSSVSSMHMKYKTQFNARMKHLLEQMRLAHLGLRVLRLPVRVRSVDHVEVI